jgi:hypothetical protein
LEQQKQIEALNAGLQKVSDRVEVSKTAPQVVNSSRGRLLRSGWLTITNKRLVFVGGSEDRTIPLNKVVFVNSNVTGIVLSVERRQKAIALEAANSLIASLIIRLCCQVSDPLNLSGDNINIDFKEWIEGVGEIQDLVESQIADSSSKNAVNFSSARTTKRSPSPRYASAIQIVRPLGSIAETQPQLQLGHFPKRLNQKRARL